MAEIADMRQQANDAARCVESGLEKGWLSREHYDTLTSSISNYRMQIVRKLRWNEARRSKLPLLGEHRKDKES